MFFLESKKKLRDGRENRADFDTEVSWPALDKFNLHLAIFEQDQYVSKFSPEHIAAEVYVLITGPHLR